MSRKFDPRRKPSIGDNEVLPRELKALRPVQQPEDKYLAMYMKRVQAGQIDHKTSRERWRGGKRRFA